MKPPRKLDDVIPKELQEGVSKPLEDFMETDLVIYTCRQVQGDRGPYMRFVVSLPDEDEQFYLATGASQPMEILAYLKEHDLFPITGKFVKAGRAIILKSSD